MLPTTQDLFEKSFTLYKTNKIILFKYTCFFGLIVLATFFIRILFSFTLFKDVSVSDINYQDLTNLPSYTKMAIAGITLFIMYLLSLWTTLTLINVIAKLYTKNVVQSVLQEFKITSKLLFPALIAIILMALSIIGGLTFLIIPGIIFSVWFAFSVYAVLLDNKRGMQALQMSKSLVNGSWWEVLWLLASTTFIIFAISLIFRTVLRFTFTLIGQLVAGSPSVVFGLESFGILLITIFGILITPLSVAIPSILYLELKKNKNL